MADVGIAELLEAGVHFGHQTRRWNPKMRRFIFGERDGIYIIDLRKTHACSTQAQEFAGGRPSRRHRAVRRHQEAGPGRRQGGAEAATCLRQPPLAGRPADQLRDDQAHRAPARPRALEARASSRCCRSASGWPQATWRSSRESRRCQGHAAPARRDVRHRPEDRGDRGQRGRACASRSSAWSTPTATPTGSTS